MKTHQERARRPGGYTWQMCLCLCAQAAAGSSRFDVPQACGYLKPLPSPRLRDACFMFILVTIPRCIQLLLDWDFGHCLVNTADRVQIEKRLGVVILAVVVIWKVALLCNIKIDHKSTCRWYLYRGQSPGIYLSHRSDGDTAFTLTAGSLPTPRQCHAMPYYNPRSDVSLQLHTVTQCCLRYVL